MRQLSMRQRLTRFATRFSLYSTNIPMPDTCSISPQVQNISRLVFFRCRLWVECDAYYAFGNSPHEDCRHRHYLVIHTILFLGQELGREVSTLVPKETLFNETKVWQIPIRDAGEGTAIQELSLVAFFQPYCIPDYVEPLPGGDLSGQ
jgi:hypothetical protein